MKSQIFSGKSELRLSKGSGAIDVNALLDVENERLAEFAWNRYDFT